jgi:aminodeoxyfutalosine synthase
MSPTPEISLDLGKIADRKLRAVGEKIASHARISNEDAQLLFTSPDLLGLGLLADYANRRKHGDVVTFAANQHINPTNVCYLRKTCVFCSFARLPKEEGAYHYTLDEVYAEAEAAAS